MFFFFMMPDGDKEELHGDFQAQAAVVLADLEGCDPASLDSLPEALLLEAAVACGYCLLSGGRQPTPGFPAWLAVPAAERLRRRIDSCIADADRLPAAWDAALPEEADDLVVGLLDARMNSWAALETLRACGDLPGLRKTLDSCEDAVAGFDAALVDRVDFLATIAETQLLANWRLLLAPRYRSPLPWWLDGTLEAEAVREEASVDSVRERLSCLRVETAAPPAPQATAGGDLRRGEFASRPSPRVETSRGALGKLLTHVTPDALAADAGPRRRSLQSDIRWRSPDNQLTARLVPGGNEPRPLMVEFLVAPATTQDSAPPDVSVDMLRGCVAVLCGVGAAIESMSTPAEEIVVAAFPLESVRVGIESLGHDAGSLFILPDGGEWRMVEASD